MRKKIIIGILVIGVMVFIASLLMPVPVGDSEQNEPVEVLEEAQQQPGQFLPWQIEVKPDGSIRVFGVTLGVTTLQEVNHLFHNGAEVSLFVSPEGQYKVEAYFDKVVLGGFASKMILVIDLPQEQLMPMFMRGSRVSSLGNGRKKVTLAVDDTNLVYSSPVMSITYLTGARVDDELLMKRFGEPAHRIHEQDDHVMHWLYPELGLDVAMSEEGNAVFQYIAPGQFDRLMGPLLIPGTH